MNNSSQGKSGDPTVLEEISTRWPLISDPLQFALRYAPAMRRYLAALVKNAHDAEDVAQTFLLRIVNQPFTADRVRGGRFRDYLKAALRNEALTWFRRNCRHASQENDLDRHPAPAAEGTADLAWVSEWRNCLLRRAWERLEQHEREAPDGLAYTVLRLTVDHPDEDSPTLAARVSAQIGRPLRPEAFRKQLSRARHRFAQLLIDVVRQTLEGSRPGDVAEELADLGLMEYVRDYLPEAFRPTSK
jgi:RNA polymerase sigma-70 factor (ECF subfamily)